MVSFTGPFKLPEAYHGAQKASGVFTLKEINRIKIIQDVIERRITTRRAAEHLWYQRQAMPQTSCPLP
jgi:hypothetical protein